MDPEAAPPASGTSNQDEATFAKIEVFLQAEDDTQRFVGLAILKSVLDNTPGLDENEVVLQRLWASVPTKFLDRLLRTGSKPSKKDAKEMLDIVVSVLYTFAVLLPEQSKSEASFIDRIPGLVGALLYGTEETTEKLLQLLYTLVSNQNGALALLKVEDLSPLTEVAPSHPTAMDILRHAWFNAMVALENKQDLAKKVDTTIQALVASFRGTDATTLLGFLGTFLRQANSMIIPLRPKWLVTVTGFIQNLVTSRPNAEARTAYTTAASSILKVYPLEASSLLFKADYKAEKPFSYLFINLLLIDIRSSAPLLLEQLNNPTYPQVSRRLASAFDIISIFIGYLVRSLEDESLETLIMSPDNLLKLRRGISETMSVTVEYLRDRWDASFAGSMGLHPDARTSATETSTGSHYTLAWDSLQNVADSDPFILSALRALALWLREDENDLLRKEATGLTDMFMELYTGSSTGELDFRSATLVALEALVTFEKGRDLLLQHNGWQILTKDLIDILQRNTSVIQEEDATRGIEIVRVLLTLAEEQSTETAEEWMDLITAVSAWDTSSRQQTPSSSIMVLVTELQVAVLQLCCELLTKASQGMRRRYVHSLNALAGISAQLEREIPSDSVLREGIEDVLMTLSGLPRV